AVSPADAMPLVVMVARRSAAMVAAVTVHVYMRLSPWPTKDGLDGTPRLRHGKEAGLVSVHPIPSGLSDALVPGVAHASNMFHERGHWCGLVDGAFVVEGLIITPATPTLVIHQSTRRHDTWPITASGARPPSSPVAQRTWA